MYIFDIYVCAYLHKHMPKSYLPFNTTDAGILRHLLTFENNVIPQGKAHSSLLLVYALCAHDYLKIITWMRRAETNSQYFIRNKFVSF